MSPLFIIPILILLYVILYFVLYPMQLQFFPFILSHSTIRSLENIDLINENYKTKYDIPKNLILTYSTIEAIPEYKIKEWTKHNPSLQIQLYGDEECIEYL